MYSPSNFGLSADILKVVSSVMEEGRRITKENLAEQVASGVWNIEGQSGSVVSVYDTSSRTRFKLEVLDEMKMKNSDAALKLKKEISSLETSISKLTPLARKDDSANMKLVASKKRLEAKKAEHSKLMKEESYKTSAGATEAKVVQAVGQIKHFAKEMYKGDIKKAYNDWAGKTTFGPVLKAEVLKRAGGVNEATDPVDKKELTKSFEKRKDKDIDNDGDTDSSDEYLHKRRKAISKAMKEESDVDEGFINLGGAKVKDDEKSILQHIKKTFPNVKKVKKDSQHGWIPVFEANKDLEEGKKENFVLVDKNNKVVATGTDERDLKLSRRSLERKFGELKLVQTKKKQSVGYPLEESNKDLEEVLDEAQKLFMFKTKQEADKKAKEIKGKVIELGPKNFAVVTKDLTVIEEVDLDEDVSVYKKTARKNKNDVTYAFGRTKKLDGQPEEKGGYWVWKLSKNYDGKVRGGIRASWVYVGKDLSYSDAVKLMNKKLGRKEFKEEVELDELSKKTLGSYVKGASHDIATKSAATGRYAERANKARKTGDYSQYKDDETADKMFNKSWKRRLGVAKAVDKLTKEELELDEAKMEAAVEKTQADINHAQKYMKAADNQGDVIKHMNRLSMLRKQLSYQKAKLKEAKETDAEMEDEDGDGEKDKKKKKGKFEKYDIVNTKPSDDKNKTMMQTDEATMLGLKEAGKWNYPADMTKTKEISDMGTTNAAKNREKRKEWRKKHKALQHKKLVQTKEAWMHPSHEKELKDPKTSKEQKAKIIALYNKKYDDTQDKEDAEAWREKRSARLKGRVYHEETILEIAGKKLTSFEKEKFYELKKKHENNKTHRLLRKQYGDKGDDIFHGKLIKMAKGTYDGTHSKNEEFEFTAEDFNNFDELAVIGRGEDLDELSKKTLGTYVKKASHDVATKAAATGRYAERANKASDDMKASGDYSKYTQKRKDDETADKMFKKSWKRRLGIGKAIDKMTKEEFELREAEAVKRGRGRPRKDAAASSETTDSGDRHIVNQMRKAVSLNGHHVVFDNGEKKHVDRVTAQAFINKYNNLDKPMHKEIISKSAIKSHEHFKNALKGKVEAPKSNKIDMPKLKSDVMIGKY
jgi:hypothetical protein